LRNHAPQPSNLRPRRSVVESTASHKATVGYEVIGIGQEMNIGIQFEWREVGEVRLDLAGKLEFPKLSVTPGVYGFRFAGQEGTITLYVGEAENLQRRAAHYRNPGSSQATN